MPRTVGVLAMDVRALDPDFRDLPDLQMAARTLWAGLPVCRQRHQDEVPLEQTELRPPRRARRAVPTLPTRATSPDARRFDMGERDHFISLEMASIGMEMMAPGATRRLSSASHADRRLADGLREAVSVPETRMRAPHILSLGFPGRNAGGVIERLAAERSTLPRASAACASPARLQRRERCGPLRRGPAPPAATVNYGVRPLGSVGERGPVAFLGSDPFAPPYSSLPSTDTSALSW